jgi:predicted DCC family thiol-disulfide oxidoreductase YuxK
MKNFCDMNSEVTEITDKREELKPRLRASDNCAEDSARYSLNPSVLPLPEGCSVGCRQPTTHSDTFRGWILYDRSCPSCTASARRFDRIFRRRGFMFLPLQTQWVMERLSHEPDAPLEQMHVLTSDGQDIGGADAVIFLARQIWWARPLVAFTRLPGMHKLLDRGYRWVAAHRGFGHVGCRADWPRSGSRHFVRTVVSRPPLLDAWPAWIALVILPIDALFVRNSLASWQFMWLMAAAIFFGCKWLTAWRALRPTADVMITRTLGYFFAWPGMDAENFLRLRGTQNSTALSRQIYTASLLRVADKRSAAWPPRSTEEVSGNMPHRSGRMPALPFLSAIGESSLGFILLFGVARLANVPLLTGWVGMVGIIFILHFGLFWMLALAWRAAGIKAEPIMNAPFGAKSLSEFWGRRWNAAFNRLALKLVFRPTVRRLGGRRSGDAKKRSRESSTLHPGTIVATLTAFFASGLIHELVISVPARAGYGLPTAYFLLQGIGILTEHRFRAIRGRVFTILITTVPAFWLFHPPFVHHVILPFMKAIGAL